MVSHNHCKWGDSPLGYTFRMPAQLLSEVSGTSGWMNVIGVKRSSRQATLVHRSVDDSGNHIDDVSHRYGSSGASHYFDALRDKKSSHHQRSEWTNDHVKQRRPDGTNR